MHEPEPDPRGVEPTAKFRQTAQKGGHRRARRYGPTTDAGGGAVLQIFADLCKICYSLRFDILQFELHKRPGGESPAAPRHRRRSRAGGGALRMTGEERASKQETER